MYTSLGQVSRWKHEKIRDRAPMASLQCRRGATVSRLNSEHRVACRPGRGRRSNLALKHVMAVPFNSDGVVVPLEEAAFEDDGLSEAVSTLEQMVSCSYLN